MKFDCYQVLGVERDATALEIKDAYRRLVRLHHPDANPQDRPASEARMKQVFEAYATLGDADKRTRYDNDHTLRAFEKSQNGVENQDVLPSVSTPASLIEKVRLALGESSEGFAAQLGLSEADLCAFEARDAMPQATLQLRTFGYLVERAAQSLQAAGQERAAAEMRSAFGRKKANRNFRR